MGVIKSKDGDLNLGVAGDGQWRSLCDAIDRADLKHHPEFAADPDRYRNRPLVWETLRPIFATRTTAEWIDLLEEHGVPAGPIYKVDEMFEEPQIQHLGIVQGVTHPARGHIHLVGQPVTLSRTPALIDTPTPDAGEHTDEVLGELGIDTDRIAALKADGVV